MIPTLKQTVQYNRLNNSVYFRSSGLSIVVDDSNNLINDLLSLMSEKLSLQDLFIKIKNSHPELSYEDYKNIINTLDEYYLLENYEIKDTQLNEYEIKRWQRNLNFFGSFCHLNESKYQYQEKIKNAKVVLLGLGGLGSHLLYDLAAAGYSHISAIEFDNVELSNLNRQILYCEEDVGLYKGDAAKKRITQFNKNLDISIVKIKIESANDLDSYISDANIVICVADRPKTEILNWVNAACVKHKIPLVTGGLDTQVARYYTVLPGKTGCVECWHQSVVKNDILSSKILNEQRLNQLRGDNAAFVTFVAILAGYMLTEIVKITTEISEAIATNKVYEIDFQTMQMKVRETWHRMKTCTICNELK